MADQYNKKALMGALGQDDEPGVMDLEPQPLQGIAGPVNAKPQPATPVSTDAPATPAPAAPAGPASPFQSQNMSTRGYLDEAVRAFAPTVKGIADEAGRKSAVEQYLRDLTPEVQRRGGTITGIQGENATVDGRIIDFFRDIEGAADPQYLDKTDEVQNGGMGGGAGLDMLGGDPLAAIQQALSQYGNSANLQALLAQLGAA